MSTIADGAAGDGHEMLFGEWLGRDRHPLALCRRVVEQAVAEKRNEYPAGTRLRPSMIGLNFLRSVMARLATGTPGPQMQTRSRGRFDRPEPARHVLDDERDEESA